MTVKLFHVKEPTIIMAKKTGVIYTNQTNGLLCDHESIEGYVLPIVPGYSYVMKPFYWCEEDNVLSPSYIDQEILKWWKEEIRNYEVEDFDIIEDAYNKEAWWNIRIKFKKQNRWHQGVLTWENSD